MAEQTILSKDELTFIRKLMQRNGEASGERPTGFRIDGGTHSNELLMQLAARANLSLQAEFEDFCMSFPVQLEEDELHSLNLQLAPPVIYERGPTTRACACTWTNRYPCWRTTVAKARSACMSFLPTACWWSPANIVGHPSIFTCAWPCRTTHRWRSMPIAYAS